jgi:hypothetical protein
LGTLILIVLVMALGGDPSALLSGAGPSEPTNRANVLNDEGKEFVSVVLADTEEVWTKLFEQSGRRYEKPKLVLFSGRVESACGLASAAVGPFYCGSDKTVYIDLSFFDTLKNRLGADGDFAQAYVIAHEVGHHVQNLLGTLDRVQSMRGRTSEREYNQMQVRLELQADALAGVWAHHARQVAELDRQDLEEAMNAASAIGDDKLQMEGQGYVVPDSFTHGTSEQRSRWFWRGFEQGTLDSADTFRASRL